MRLTAELERISLIDRALLISGGAPWIRMRFAKILATLDGQLQLNGAVPPE